MLYAKGYPLTLRFKRGNILKALTPMNTPLLLRSLLEKRNIIAAIIGSLLLMIPATIYENRDRVMVVPEREENVLGTVVAKHRGTATVLVPDRGMFLLEKPGSTNGQHVSLGTRP